MLSRAGALSRKFANLTRNLGSDDYLAIHSAETIIDSAIDETLHRKTHKIDLQKIAKCLSNENSEKSRELLQVLFCMYETAGWSISLEDDFLILE